MSLLKNTLVCASLVILMASPVAWAQSDNPVGSTGITDKEADDFANFSVRDNSRRLFVFQETGGDFKNEIVAYTYRYPKNTHPNKIMRRALKYEVQLAEHKAGYRPRGIQNMVQITDTTRQDLNGRNYNTMRRTIGGKFYEFFVYSHKQQVTVVRASVESGNANTRRNQSSNLNRTVKGICPGRC